MHRIAAHLTTLRTTILTRATALRQDSERGSVTLEQIVITLAFFLVAGVVVGVITAAVNSRTSQIK